MAQASRALAQILRETANRLDAGAEYQWSHFGKCNCGHLAQTATRLSAVDIHRSASQKLSEWSEIPNSFCPQTGWVVDRVIDCLFELGLSAKDLAQLEDLSDPSVLRHLAGGRRHLARNRREDAVVYLRTWSALMEAELDAELSVVDNSVPRACGTNANDPVFGSDLVR